ncbi:MAG: helix-turn-helix transcriptional regulator [Candidatus Limnocylindrales bacterium]
MTANERLQARGAARARSILADFGSSVRHARLDTGWSQDEVGRRLRMSGDKVWQIEHERLPSLSIADACQMAAVLGLDLSCRLYPSDVPVRDAAQAPRLVKLLANVGNLLRYVTDAPLPPREGIPERRAWDALIAGAGERTGVEF